MDAAKERFLRNEFLTMSLLGALGRSRTYSANALDEDKVRFRNAFRECLEKVSREYESTVSEDKHCSNVISISEELTPKFRHCLRSGRLRLGIVQKALNLFLKYLWCVNLIPPPPHCPFDSIVINNLPDCSDINWTALDTIKDYKRIVSAAQKVVTNNSLSEWELDLWLKQVQSDRTRKRVGGSSAKGSTVNLTTPSQAFPLNTSPEIKVVITGKVIRRYVDEKENDKCEIVISKACSHMLHHEYRKRFPILVSIGGVLYELGVHENQKGVVWISSRMYTNTKPRDKADLTAALSNIGVISGDAIRIVPCANNTYLLQKDYNSVNAHPQ